MTFLGQVFTPPAVVETMLALRRCSGRVLEPSAGDGAFSTRIAGCTALEIDARVAPPGARITDFFAFPESERFATIIGNPPYVKYRDIPPDTALLLRSDLFDGRSNLYLFFIEKAVRHLEPGGELIFITPRDFLKTTSSIKLNRWLLAQGSITDAIELGDIRVFDDAVPNCLIWRFEKGQVSRETRYAEIGAGMRLEDALKELRWETRQLLETAGHLQFARQRYTLRVSDLFSVKVGGVSGADALFASLPGNREFVCSETVRTGKTRHMLWTAPDSPAPHPAQLAHKEQLIARRVRPFDETNWWTWGRGYPQTDAPRIYVNGRTRHSQPFFLHPCTHFDGSVLALFPHDPALNLEEIATALNEVDWADLGFICDGRFLFTQRSLENAPLPERFGAYQAAGV